jgi:hypothetical protein
MDKTTEPVGAPSGELLNSLCYVERESPFGMIGWIAGGKERVERLRRLFRATGVIAGTIQEYDEQTRSGKIEIEGQIFDFQDVQEERKTKPQPLKAILGQPAILTFWPTFDELPKGNRKKLPSLKISCVRRHPEPAPGYVEVIGKLEKIQPGKFLVSLWSQVKKQNFYIIFSGDYPFEDEVGKYVWVIGKFDAKTGTICYQEASLLSFVPPEEARKIIKKQKQNAGFPEKIHGPAENLWSALQKETNRMSINAKLKIILREFPNNLQDTGDIIVIPLQNEPKNVPGGLELSSTPVDLLVSRKSWNKAKKNADAISQTGKRPLYIFEAMIGIRENHLVAVVSGIQVVEAKEKEASEKIE